MEPKKLKLSNTAVDLYNLCPRKYKFRYIENLKGDFTSTPLLFGTAIDAALNFILESKKFGRDWTVDQAKEIFVDKMREWEPETRLEFFKNEVPEELIEDYDAENPETWEAVWENLVNRGLNCIDVYVNEILPQFKEIISVQNKFEITNEEGYRFVGVIDFIVKLQDDRIVLMDNKTASAKYPKNKVITSQQLSLYIEQFPDIKYAGYCVLIKNPAKEKGLTYQLMVDIIPEETIAGAYNKLDETLNNIAQDKFECNPKGCYSFGKKCEYYAACKFNNYQGLIPAYEIKKEAPKNENPSHAGEGSE